MHSHNAKKDLVLKLVSHDRRRPPSLIEGECVQRPGLRVSLLYLIILSIIIITLMIIIIRIIIIMIILTQTKLIHLIMI